VTTARSWWRRGDNNPRVEAQAAKDAAAQAFYELDTAQRDLEISMETISAVDDSAEARRALAGFRALGELIDQVSGAYIAAVDAHDLDRDELDHTAASRARGELTRAKDELENARRDLERFQSGLGPLLGKAETQLARLAPARESAKQSLLAASGALDAVRAAGLKADDLAARLAALAPELTKLNEGASKHGVTDTVRRADDVRRKAEAVRTEAERLPAQARELDKRLVSLRTRVQALATRAEGVTPVLSELRRGFSAACWQDLQTVPDQAAQAVRQAEEALAEARRARAEQRWADAAAKLAAVRSLMDDVDGAVGAAGDRLRRLNEVRKDPKAEVEKTRFAIRDAQRLAMQGRATPEPRHARPLDEAVARLDSAVAALGGRHPDYWAFLTETAAVRETANRVVANIREDRAAGR
jgi:DNA repair exonuclease SbcCD ATPase subunit